MILRHVSNYAAGIILFTGIMVILMPIQISAEDDVVSEAYAVIDANTGALLDGKNHREEMYPASLTKIATAIIAIEHLDLDEEVTISNKAIHADGTRVYLEEGESLTVEQLLYGIMISSANDASIALAEHISGSVESFSRLMNTYIQDEIGLENTHFTNPHGLFDEDHVTTAEDIARIMKYALENDTYRKLAEKTDYHWQSEGWDTRIFHHHAMRRHYDFVTAGKNGFVSQSGLTLATSGIQDQTELIVVTLNAPSRSQIVSDTLLLFERNFNLYETVTIDIPPSLFPRTAKAPDSVSLTTLRNESVRLTFSEDYLMFRGHAGRLIHFHRIPISDAFTLHRSSVIRQYPESAYLIEDPFIARLN